MKKRKIKRKKSSFTGEDSVKNSFFFDDYKKGAFIGGLIGGITGVIIGKRIILGIIIGSLAGGYIAHQMNIENDKKPFTTV